MKTFRKTDAVHVCGYWNGSPLEVIVTGILRGLKPDEAYHYHDYHEYYVAIQGRAALFVEGEEVVLEPDGVVMVQPGERHRVAWVDPEQGIRWVIIKERSAPNSRTVVPEPEDAADGGDGNGF